MDKREFAELCLKQAAKKYQSAELFVQSSTESGISLYNGELDEFQIAESWGAQLAVRHEDSKVYAYTEEIAPDSVDYLLKQIDEQLALDLKVESTEFMAPDSKPLDPLTAIQGLTFEATKARAFLDELHAQFMAATEDARLLNLNLSFVEESKLILNTAGLDREMQSQYAMLQAYLVLAKGEEMQNSFDFRFIYDWEELDKAAFAHDLIAKVEALYGGKSVPSGHYKVIIENNCFASLLAALSSAFSAENVQNGLSLLAGRLDSKVGSAKLNLGDNPRHRANPLAASFDDEGVATRDLLLIEKGVLKHYLYDMQSAAKDGVESSGNAGRSYKGKAHPGSSFLYLEPGKLSFEELLREVDNGLIITDLQGLHSGLDPVSGDFSLAANGFLIKDGKKDHAVKQITVAGNLLDLLSKISEIGSDVKLSPNLSYIPSVLVEELAVAGEA